MKGRIHLGNAWWELEPESLSGLREVAADPWEVALVNALAAWWDDTDAMELMTSGSTGAPKPVCHPKARMEASAIRTIEALKLHPGTSASLVMPVQFVGGMMMVVRAIVGGWSLYTTAPSALPILPLTALDFLACTPSQAQAMTESRPKAWNQIQCVLLGGGAPSRAWLEQLKAGPELWESFGMTETISHFALRKIHPKRSQAFTCLPGFSVSNAAEEALVVHTPWGEELLTRDAAHVLSPDRFVWCGRLDDVVNSGGIKLHPDRVEAELSDRISQPFRCYGVPDERFGQVLKLRIHSEGPPANAAAIEEELLSWARMNLPKHHAPKSVEWRPLKQTASGKWKRPKHESNDHA